MKRKKGILVGLVVTMAILFFGSSSVLAWTQHHQKGMTVWSKTKAYNGYVIFRVSALGKTVLIDMNGNVVRMWDGLGQEMLPPEWANGERGHVLVSQGTKVQERDWNNKVVWEYNGKDLRWHHDWQKLPSGNYLILGRADVPENLVPKAFYGPGIEGTQPIKMKKKMYGDRITEITPGGKILWDWYAHDHLDLQLTSNTKAWFNKVGYIENGDWTHFNAIHYSTNPGYENKIMASNRHQNEAIMIDKKTGDIVWRWGKDIIGHQHDVQMIDPGLPGEGNILMMDNGYGSKIATGVSTVFEVDPKTNKIVWFFSGTNPSDGTFRSWHISGCQRQPNGNTLIIEGETGRIFEVSKEKEIVWEYVNPFYRAQSGGRMDNSVFKARKVPASWVPKNIQLTPELAAVASLMGQARAQYESADALVEQANQLMKYSK